MSGTVITPQGLVLIPDPQFGLAATIGSFGGVAPATLQSWLGATQTALHNITVTGQPTTVQYGTGDGTKSVTYSRTNEAALRNHIRELQKILGIGPGRRPIRLRF